jgi:hypothetical protein
VEKLEKKLKRTLRAAKGDGLSEKAQKLAVRLAKRSGQDIDTVCGRYNISSSTPASGVCRTPAYLSIRSLISKIEVSYFYSRHKNENFPRITGLLSKA